MIPSYAEVRRGYAKWTDENGVFHKVRVDGNTPVEIPVEEAPPVIEEIEDDSPFWTED